MKQGWEIKKLGEVCEIANGSTPLRSNKEFWENGNYPWFTIDDIREQGRIIRYTKQLVTEAALKRLRILPVDTILLCCTASIGEYAITEIEITTNQQFNGLIIKDKKELLPKFLLYFSSTLNDKLSKLSGKTTIDFIPISRLKDIDIPLPPLPEQQRIVAILNEAIASIANAKTNAEQNLINVKELFESYLQSVFTNKDEGWEEKCLDEIIESNITGLTKNASEQRLEYKYKYVKMNNITRDNRFDLSKYTSVNATEEEASKYSLSEGDFLFNTRNSYELVGKTCLFENFNDEVILYNNNIMRIRFKQNINPYFINYTFTTKSIIEKLERLKSGTTNVSAIYYKDLKNLCLLIPPLKDQQIIVQKLDALIAKTKKLEVIYQQKLNVLDELKKSILQKAFNGELKTA